jgi:hypothetical protein
LLTLDRLTGEVAVSAQTVADDQQPLNGSELKPVADERYTYQPNPIWGNKTQRR